MSWEKNRMLIAEHEARFILLVMAVVEETATAEELAEFRGLLREHPEFKLQYLEQMKIHGLMCFRASADSGPVAIVKRQSVTRHFRAWLHVAAAALVVLGAVAVGVGRHVALAIARSENVSGEVRVISGCRVALVREGRLLHTGDELEAMDPSGAAVVVWTDGSRLSLPPGSRVVLSQTEGEKRITLLTGAFEATFSKQRPGECFMIVTPEGQAKVLGTTVKVVRGTSGTAISVVQGRVRVERTSDGAEADVSSRHEVLVSACKDSGELRQTRFYWADRFAGGGRAGAVARQYAGERSLNTVQDGARYTK
jgi:ferric-dicitrate binding protein FerR (iron transport regulator)